LTRRALDEPRCFERALERAPANAAAMADRSAWTHGHPFRLKLSGSSVDSVEIELMAL
jgi:hypothetical protein